MNDEEKCWWVIQEGSAHRHAHWSIDDKPWVNWHKGLMSNPRNWVYGTKHDAELLALHSMKKCYFGPHCGNDANAIFLHPDNFWIPYCEKHKQVSHYKKTVEYPPHWNEEQKPKGPPKWFTPSHNLWESEVLDYLANYKCGSCNDKPFAVANAEGTPVFCHHCRPDLYSWDDDPSHNKIKGNHAEQIIVDDPFKPQRLTQDPSRDYRHIKGCPQTQWPNNKYCSCYAVIDRNSKTEWKPDKKKNKGIGTTVNLSINEMDYSTFYWVEYD